MLILLMFQLCLKFKIAYNLAFLWIPNILILLLVYQRVAAPSQSEMARAFEKWAMTIYNA